MKRVLKNKNTLTHTDCNKAELQDSLFYFDYEEELSEAHNAVVMMALEEQDEVDTNTIKKQMDTIIKHDKLIRKSYVEPAKLPKNINNEIAVFATYKAPFSSLIGIFYGCRQFGYFENFDPFNIGKEGAEYPYIYEKVNVYASFLKSTLKENPFDEKDYKGCKYVLKKSSNLSKQLNYAISYFFECFSKITNNTELTKTEQFICGTLWNKYLFTKDLDIATLPFYCNMKITKKIELIKYGNSLLDRLTHKKISFETATIIGILLSLDTVLSLIKKEKYKQAINLLSKVQSIHSIQTDYDRIPQKGGATTASYWKQEKDKLEIVWKTFPQDVKKSNKKSVNLLQDITKTQLSYRKLEEYIRNWRKNS